MKTVLKIGKVSIGVGDIYCKGPTALETIEKCKNSCPRGKDNQVLTIIISENIAAFQIGVPL